MNGDASIMYGMPVSCMVMPVSCMVMPVSCMVMPVHVWLCQYHVWYASIMYGYASIMYGNARIMCSGGVLSKSSYLQKRLHQDLLKTRYLNHLKGILKCI